MSAGKAIEGRSLSQSSFGVGGGAAFLMVLLAAAASLYPFVTLLLSSLKPPLNGSFGELWLDLFDQIPVGRYMLNTAIVSLGAMVIVAVVSCMAGYGFAKLPFPGSAQILVVIVATLSVPQATIIIPNYFNFARVGGVGNYAGPILMYAANSMPFSTILMVNYFKSLPDELVESAVIDGASYWTVFWQIMVPLATPALATVSVLCFLGSWNDFLVSLLFLPDDSMRTIGVGVATLQGARDQSLDLILTGSLLSAIPPIVTFILFQRYLVSGIVSGITK